MKITSERRNEYVAWQNRALWFYLSARLLNRHQLYAPSSHSAVIAIELLLKATLIYWDSTFDPQDGGHAIAKLQRIVHNKAPGSRNIVVPSYFYDEQQYLMLSRYPTRGKGFVVPVSFIEDLDKVFAETIVLAWISTGHVLANNGRGKVQGFPSEG